MNLGLAITNGKQLITNSFVRTIERSTAIGVVTIATTAPAISQNSELEQVQMASLQYGTSHESQTVLNATAKQLVIITANSDCQPLECSRAPRRRSIARH